MAMWNVPHPDDGKMIMTSMMLSLNALRTR